MWTCSCGTGNLEDVCRLCGTGTDGVIKDQQRNDDWKRNNPEQAKKQAKVVEDNRKKIESLNSIIISTGDIKEPYQIIDAIFTFDSNREKANWFTTWLENPMMAFGHVKNNLRHLCYSLGGDAVINCQFEYRIALTDDNTKILEIFAYGTAVKLKKVEGQA